MMRKVPIPQPLLLYKQEKDNTCWAATARTLYHYATGMQISENEFIEKARNFNKGTCSTSQLVCNQPETPLLVQKTLSAKFGLHCNLIRTNLYCTAINLVSTNIPFILNISFQGRSVGHSYFAYSGSVDCSCLISVDCFDPSMDTYTNFVKFTGKEICNQSSSILFV